MKKIVSLLFVSLIAVFGTGCARFGDRLRELGIRKGWQGESMEKVAAHAKPSFHYDIAPKPVANFSLRVDSGFGDTVHIERGTYVFHGKTWDPVQGSKFYYEAVPYGYTNVSHVNLVPYPSLVNVPAVYSPSVGAYVPTVPPILRK